MHKIACTTISIWVLISKSTYLWFFVLAELKQNAAEKLALREEVKKIQTELNETRSQLCVADLRLESDLEVEKRKAQEEIATLQQLFQGIFHIILSFKYLY